MSKSHAFSSFNVAIRDVEELIETYDLINKDHAGRDPEVLKRAALIMVMTAWETYVEDRFSELVNSYLMGVSGSPVYDYINSKVTSELKYFHTPDSSKTKKLFEVLLRRDITEKWNWDNFDSKRVRETLNRYIKLRGDVVHRAVTDKQGAHPVKKEEVVKCIRFMKSLVEVMDNDLMTT